MNKSEATRVLGIDPGLSITGYGLIETAFPVPTLIEAGVLRNRSGEALEKRLRELYEGILKVIENGNPKTVAVESLFSNYKHPTSALQMAHARGVLFLAAAQAGLPVFSYEPARVKKSLTGRGRASKRQVQDMIQSVFSLDRLPEPPDVADALAVALCHANTLKSGTVIDSRGSRRLPEIIERALENSHPADSGPAPLDQVLKGIAKKK